MPAGRKSYIVCRHPNQGQFPPIPVPPATMTRSPLLPVALLFLAALFWGLCIPVMKALGVEQSHLFPEAGSLPSSLASLAARFGLAGLSVALLARTAPSAFTRFELRHGLGIGLVTTASMFLQVDGLSYTSASTAGFLIALYCVIVPLLAWMVGLRRFTALLFACCLLVLLGLGILTGVSADAIRLGRGEWENLGAAALFAVQILWIGRLPAASFNPMRLTAVLCLSVSAASLLLLAFQGPGLATLERIHASPRAAVITVFLALLGTAAPFLIMNRWQPRVDPVLAGFIYCFEPIASALGALFLPEMLVRAAELYPNEPLTLRVWLGGCFILAANLLLLRDKPGLEAPKPH